MSTKDSGSVGRPAEQGFWPWLWGYLRCCRPEAERLERRMGQRRVHLANERTFLAWIRVSLGLMALGFVVQRFDLFIKRLGELAIFGAEAKPLPPVPHHLGSALVVVAALIGLLATARFLIVEFEIETDTYRPLFIFNISIGLLLLGVGIFLAYTLWAY